MIWTGSVTFMEHFKERFALNVILLTEHLSDHQTCSGIPVHLIIPEVRALIALFLTEWSGRFQLAEVIVCLSLSPATAYFTNNLTSTLIKLP